MQETTLAEILEWSTNLPAWQRDALRRLFTAGPLTSADIDDLLALCKGKYGLNPPGTAEPLRETHLAIGDTSALPIFLLDVTHHHGVNALAPEQIVSFGPHLTIVYGQNAAGKSGYTRILKRACRSRSTEEILGNVLSDGAPLKAKATIRFRVGDTEYAAPWSPEAAPTGALAAVSVFDAHCAPVYLREKTDVAFRPFSLDIFDKLSSACAELRRQLEAEQQALSAAVPALPQVAEGTKVASLFKNITSLSKPEDYWTLATLSEAEEKRLKHLQAAKQDLQASNPLGRAQELALKATRFEALASHLSQVSEKLGDSSLASLRAAVDQLTAARAALTHLRQTVLTPDLLPGTGEETWRRLWEAAGEFSRVAYSDHGFPVTASGAKCVLCQQPLSDGAVERFAHFVDLVTSTAQADVRAAETAYAERLGVITRTIIDRDDIPLVIEEIEVDDPTLAERLKTFLGKAKETKDAVERAVADKESPPSHGVGASPADDLRSAGKALRERSAQLRKQAPSLEAKDAAELNELEGRVSLREHLDVVLGEIERRKRIAAYGHCLEDVNTLPITRKSTELTKRLITERLQAGFQSELRKLDFAHLAVEIRAAGGAKGALFHQLAFSNAPGTPVAKVLSEGESRALSLASFLAELTTAPAASAIIFDDPVSSLDHIWRERIARRLVDEAKTRQVIVFTHDLVFLKQLLDECEKQDVACQHQYIRRGEDAAGLSSKDLPWVAMRVKERMGVLRQRWQAAEKRSRSEGSEVYEREAREIYGLLREAWEQAVGEVLLHEVIDRYRPSIETKRLKVLHDISEEDCAAVEAGMTECSRWIRGHDQAAANGTPFPKPDQLSKLIDDLESWTLTIRKRREGKKIK